MNLSNVKKTATKSMDVLGFNTEGVTLIKDRMDSEDTFLIWKIDHENKWVITSSSLQIHFAAEISKTSSHLSACIPFIDGCEKTLRGKGTEIKVTIYHPVMRKVLTIAKIKGNALTENSEIVHTLLLEISQMTQLSKGVPFSPVTPWMCDSSGALALGLKKFDADVRLSTCEAHFFREANSIKRRLNEFEGKSFETLCRMYVTASSTWRTAMLNNS